MASQNFEGGSYLTPTSRGSLPSVTLPILMDYLVDYEVLQQPGPTRRTFHWFVAVSHESTAGTAPGDIDDANLLFVCRAHNVQSVLDERPTAFALVLVGEDEDLPPEITDVADRMIAIRQQDRFSYFVFLLQSWFMQLLVWENELDHIVMRQGSLSEMLDISVPVMKNFMFITDNSFNVIAHTTVLEPPDDLHRRIIDTGCLTPQMIAEKRMHLPEKTFYTKEPSSLTPYERLSYPIYLSHTYFGSVSMSCCNRLLTEGLKNLFSLFFQHAMPLFERMWRSQVKLNIPYYFFFSKLLDHAPVSDEYVSKQLEMASLDDQTQFKLIVLEIDTGADPERAALVTHAGSFLNQRRVFCFTYRSDVLALCWSPPSDGELSHHKTVDELNSYIFEPYRVASGVSEVFEHITDLDLAYQQAKLALGLKNTICSEQFLANEDEGRGVFLFEDALLYVLVDPIGKDERFMRFCFSHSILQKIHAEDKEKGTNYLALFWFYLHSERNATAVAAKLRMHRNTVLYHIDKIQKRFDFDLSLQSARDRMLLDFKVFFLTESHESIEKSFSNVYMNEEDTV